MTDAPVKQLWLPTPAGPRLNVIHFPSRATAPKVIITHGAFSRASFLLRLSHFLHHQGFEVWLFEWRGHGDSDPDDGSTNYESLAEVDLQTVLLHVTQHSQGSAPIFFVGHSVGGVLPWMLLARHPELRSLVAGVVSIGSQITGAGSSLARRAGLLGIAAAVHLLDGAPCSVFRVGPNDEAKGVMSQWVSWNRQGQWLGYDGFDYSHASSQVQVPALLLAGGGDTLVAPLHGVAQLHAALGSADKTLLHCARSAGFAEDYTHGGLVCSPAAMQELWPLIATWIARATRYTLPLGQGMGGQGERNEMSSAKARYADP